MVADGMPGSYAAGPKDHVTASLFFYVDDCDVVYSKALTEGCTVIYEMMDAFWGDRMGTVKDPYGHVWAIASQKWILSREETAKNQEEWLKSMASGR
jgi:PhnB protein